MQSSSYVLGGSSLTICVSMLDPLAISDGAASFVQPAFRFEGRSLYTATLHLTFEDYSISMFHACRAKSRSEVMDRIRIRVAPRLLADVVIREGIDPDHPVVARLLPSEIARRLADYGDCNRSHGPLRQGGDLHIQERSGA